MNDPFVEKVYYKVQTPPDIDYDDAPPIESETKDFSIKLSDDRVTFEMKKQFTNRDQARDALSDFINRWELYSDVLFNPGDFRLEYQKAKIIDKNPTNDESFTADVEPVRINPSVQVTEIHVSRSSYPEPPIKFELNETVKNLINRFSQYKREEESILHLAQICKEALIKEAKENESVPSEYFQISKNVIEELGKLANRWHPSKSRHYYPDQDELTSIEENWLKTAIPRIIQRMGEKESKPESTYDQLTKDDFG